MSDWQDYVHCEGQPYVSVDEADEEVARLQAELSDLKTAHGFVARDNQMRKHLLEKRESEIEALSSDNARLRVLLALSYCGEPGALYTDDGELQDLRDPPIDFKRDSIEDINSKMSERVRSAAAEYGGAE